MVTTQEIIDMFNSLEKGDVLEIKCARGVVQTIHLAEHGGFTLSTTLTSYGKRKSFGFTFFDSMEEGWRDMYIRIVSKGYGVYNLLADTFREAKVVRA